MVPNDIVLFCQRYEIFSSKSSKSLTTIAYHFHIVNATPVLCSSKVFPIKFPFLFSDSLQKNKKLEFLQVIYCFEIQFYKFSHLQTIVLQRTFRKCTLIILFKIKLKQNKKKILTNFCYLNVHNLRHTILSILR